MDEVYLPKHHAISAGGQAARGFTLQAAQGAAGGRVRPPDVLAEYGNGCLFRCTPNNGIYKVLYKEHFNTVEYLRGSLTLVERRVHAGCCDSSTSHPAVQEEQ